MFYWKQINTDSVQDLPNDPNSHNTNHPAKAPKQSVHAFTYS